MQKTIQLSLLSVALLSQLNAKEVTLKPLEVTASLGTNLEKKDLTDSMTIITKEQIDEARVTNLADALNRLGGIAMTQNGIIVYNSHNSTAIVLHKSLSCSSLLYTYKTIAHYNDNLYV